MKRLVSLMLALVLGIYSFGVLTYAEESEHVSGINELIVDEVGVERAFTYYSYDDEQLYMVKVYENRIDVLNADTLEITFSAERIKGEEVVSILPVEIIPNTVMQPMLINQYDSEAAWSAWAFVRRDSLQITDETGTISEIIGILYGEFAKITTECAFTIATAVYNYRYRSVDAEIHRSINKYCGILQKERYTYYYNGTTNYAYEETYGPSWFGNPWDYSEPAACRVLAEKY